jgi:hypothetical protein
VTDVEFTLNIDCDNAAFGDEPENEIIRLLNEVAERLGRGFYSGKVRDVNGNTVGDFDLEVDEEDEDGGIPDEVQEIIDQAEAGEDLEVLGVGQSANRVYDDGEWRVWIERVGPEDGYFGPRVVVEHYDGIRWSDYEGEERD